MRCIGFLTEAKLAEEGRRYGNAGGRPQVIWSNGVLASTGVGLAVDLVCDWTGRCATGAYQSYDGNEFTLKPSPLLRNLDGFVCPHFRDADVGPPILTEL